MTKTIEEYYGISDERAIEIKLVVMPIKHASASEVADAVFDVCRDENEIKYAIAHLAAFSLEMARQLYESERVIQGLGL